MLNNLELQLATEPRYGDSGAIVHARNIFYKVALELLARESQQVKALPPSALRGLIRDPTLRLGVHDALVKLYEGADTVTRELDELLVEARDLLVADPQTSPLERAQLRRAYLPLTTTAVWMGADVGAPLAARFVAQFEREVLPNQLTGVTSDGQILATTPERLLLMNQAVEILHRSLPRLAAQVFDHVTMVMWVDIATHDARTESGSARTFPGVLFLSAEDLVAPWPVAKALLHEAVHAKFFDLYLVNEFIPPTYRAIESSRVQIPWNRRTDMQDNRWPLDQALAAFHVYVHLASFACNSLRLPVPGMSRAELLGEADKALERARFLAEALLATDELGRDAPDFCRWLDGVRKLLADHATGATPQAGPYETRYRLARDVTVHPLPTLDAVLAASHGTAGPVRIDEPAASLLHSAGRSRTRPDHPIGDSAPPGVPWSDDDAVELIEAGLLEET